MTFLEFYGHCLPLSAGRSRQAREYLDAHSTRFHQTYSSCARHLERGARVLSIGAGAAYVESVLAAKLRAEVTILDFPGMLAAQAERHAAAGFATIAANILEYEADAAAGGFDLILSSEVVEHVPEAPSRHFARFRPLLKPGGVFVVTTPNFANFRNILRFVLQKPVLEAPERSFAPVAFENEGYHRREYMPGEIVSALEANRLQVREIAYTMNAPPRVFRDYLFAPAERLVPRWRMTQIVSARAV